MRALPLIVLLCAALLMAPATAANADVTIPVNKDYMASGGMVVHLEKVVVSDNYHGNVFSPDPENTKWYDLYFTYENRGNIAQTGHLEVSFYDDGGNKYPADSNITDITMNMMQPGEKSDKVRFVEAAVIPKDANIRGFQVFEGVRTTRYDIEGGQPSEPSTATPGNTNRMCLSALLLPFAAGAIVLYRIKRLA